MRRRGQSRRKQTRYHAKPRAMRLLETIGPKVRNKIPVIKQIRAFKAKRQAFKRKIVGNTARLATLGYVKPLSHKSLKPCKGLRKQIKKAYFGFKAIRNWKRGGNRAKDFRPKKVANSRFTVLNCK